MPRMPPFDSRPDNGESRNVLATTLGVVEDAHVLRRHLGDLSSVIVMSHRIRAPDCGVFVEAGEVVRVRVTGLELLQQHLHVAVDPVGDQRVPAGAFDAGRQVDQRLEDRDVVGGVGADLP